MDCAQTDRVWRASRLQRLLMVNAAQCRHEPGTSIASRARCSPRQLEQTWCGSLLEILLPHRQRWSPSLRPLSREEGSISDGQVSQ